MLFWIFVIIAATFFVVYAIWGANEYEVWPLEIAIPAVCVVAVMLVIILCSNFVPEIQKQQLEQNQNSLEYKINSGIYKDDFDILDKDIVAEVNQWNNSVIFNKAYQNDFWVGVFIPDIYDDAKIFDYGQIK